MSSDMSKWVLMQLNRGSYGDGKEKHIFSGEVHREMWTPQTVRPVGRGGAYRTNFAFYGLGWNLADMNGYLHVSHTGGHSGIVTQVTMLPELSLGIIVLTNQEEVSAFTAITNSIIDGYLGIRNQDRVKELKATMLQQQAEAKEITDRVWATVNARRDEPVSGGCLRRF
jgi:hypothetical protein